MTHDGRRRAVLAIDTATARVVIATGSEDGVADGVSTWEAGYRHGETLLPSIGRFLGEQNIRRSRLVGIVVGTGPGAFTGLRVGIATAKGLAHGLGIPLVGVSTAEALIRAAGGTGIVLLQPAGPNDRVLSRTGVPSRLLAPEESRTLRRVSGSSPWTLMAGLRERRSWRARPPAIDWAMRSSRSEPPVCARPWGTANSRRSCPST